MKFTLNMTLTLDLDLAHKADQDFATRLRITQAINIPRNLTYVCYQAATYMMLTWVVSGIN